MEYKYDVLSPRAEEFINDREIRDTLAYARDHKSDGELIFSLLERARDCKGLTHREAAVLLECDIPKANERMKEVAMEIKQKLYGNRIVMFAPLYLSNYCVNGCTYCPYHYHNKHIRRKKLTQEEIRQEVIALQDMGHKRLAIESGEDPVISAILQKVRCCSGSKSAVQIILTSATVRPDLKSFRSLQSVSIWLPW